MTHTSGAGANELACVSIAGITKIFLGEIVERGILKFINFKLNFIYFLLARYLMTQDGEVGPIRPIYYREAIRWYKNEGKIPYLKPKRFFTRR